MSTRRRIVSVLMVAALWPCLFAGPLVDRSQDMPKASVGQPAAVPQGQETGPAPRPVREMMAVYTLLVWVWLSIAVLFWLLKLRVKEADRVFRMGLRSKVGKAPEETGN